MAERDLSVSSAQRTAADLLKGVRMTAKVGAGLSALLGHGVASGSLGVVGTALEALEMYLLREGAQRVEDSGKKVDWRAAGLGLAARCAAEGARAGDVMSEQWTRLLAACLDPDLKGVVRHADIALLATLNPPDAFLLLMFTRHRELVEKEWVDSPVRSAFPINQPHYDQHKFPLKLVAKYATAVLGHPLALSDDELTDAYDSRMYQENHDRDRDGSVPLWSDDRVNRKWVAPTSLDPRLRDHAHLPMLAFMVCPRVQPQAQRLARLLTDPREKQAPAA